jgi:two-component system chemotaxis response regulator CheY
MALDTKPRLFVVCAPTRRTTRCEKSDADAGRSKVVVSSSPETPGSSGSEDHVDPGDDNATVSAGTKQTSADVLVVDDDIDVRWTVAEVLRSAGFTVAEAEDGEIALDMLRTGSYRMILLDLRMPRRDGVSLIEAVGEAPPVIVHSAYMLEASDRERLGSRVVDYLHKPVSPQKLLRAVEAVLGTGD